MATIKQLIPFILKWEGGYVDNPADAGGPTNRGVTLKIWQDCGYDKNGDGIIDEEDLKQVFVHDVVDCVLRPHFWDRWQADRIKNQSIANLLVDWLWASGTVAITTTQRLLNLKPDGIVGEKTLAAINNYPNPQELFNRLKAERTAYIEQICVARPANRQFKKGWLNRLNDIQFTYFILMVFLVACFMSCKSIATTGTARTDTKMIAHEEKESDEELKSQWNRIVTNQAESEADTETTIETVIVRFDTSLTDTITGRHPVKEVERRVASMGKVVRSSASEEVADSQSDTTTIHTTVMAERLETVASRQKTVTVSHPRLWIYWAIVPVIFLSAGAGWLFKRKVAGFFLRE